MKYLIRAHVALGEAVRLREIQSIPPTVPAHDIPGSNPRECDLGTIDPYKPTGLTPENQIQSHLIQNHRLSPVASRFNVSRTESPGP